MASQNKDCIRTTVYGATCTVDYFSGDAMPEKEVTNKEGEKQAQPRPIRIISPAMYR